ncbi:hypothetical protein J6590_026917 [Homalodisca vitripennis]|nr:hypothetical protein J6590_026917 [Homalodisca vitripennis]
MALNQTRRPWTHHRYSFTKCNCYKQASVEFDKVGVNECTVVVTKGLIGRNSVLSEMNGRPTADSGDDIKSRISPSETIAPHPPSHHITVMAQHGQSVVRHNRVLCGLGPLCVARTDSSGPNS